MSELEIPERALTVACDVYDAELIKSTGECAEKEAARAAAPIIVAADYRKMIKALWADRDAEAEIAFRWATVLDEKKPPLDDQRHQILSGLKGRIDGLRIAIDMLVARADELDPEGVAQ